MLLRVILRIELLIWRVFKWFFIDLLMVSMVWLVQSIGGRSCMGRVVMVLNLVVMLFLRVISRYPLGSCASVKESLSGEPA